MIAVPERFAAMRIARSGEAGRSWIASLPTTVARLCERWDLVVDGAPMHGELSLVVPVSREGDRLVLKVAWRIEEGRLHRYFDALVDAARCDAEIARAWTVVRSVDYWLWGLANGLTEDPVRCAAIVEALLGRI